MSLPRTTRSGERPEIVSVATSAKPRPDIVIDCGGGGGETAIVDALDPAPISC